MIEFSTETVEVCCCPVTMLFEAEAATEKSRYRFVNKVLLSFHFYVP